jgi:hypothetical protein
MERLKSKNKLTSLKSPEKSKCEGVAQSKLAI